MQNQSVSIDPEWTIIKLLKWTTSYFKSKNIDSPRADAEILLAHVLKLRRIDLYLKYDQPLNSDELAAFKTLIKRRIDREPVAYILGIKGFWSMDFLVTKDVLIPRPETELLVETALKLLPEDPLPDGDSNPKRILELGTGSGAVILSLASIRPPHLYFASDRIPSAAFLAMRNARRHSLQNVVGFFSADWFGAFKEGCPLFDMILSNPPYVPSRIIGSLQPEITRYEPISALDGGEDGLSCLRHIIQNAHLYLGRQGYLLLEIGHDQKDAVRRIIEQCSKYEHITYTKDYNGRHRVVQMRKKAEI